MRQAKLDEADARVKLKAAKKKSYVPEPKLQAEVVPQVAVQSRPEVKVDSVAPKPVVPVPVVVPVVADSPVVKKEVSIPTPVAQATDNVVDSSSLVKSKAPPVRPVPLSVPTVDSSMSKVPVEPVVKSDSLKVKEAVVAVSNEKKPDTAIVAGAQPVPENNDSVSKEAPPLMSASDNAIIISPIKQGADSSAASSVVKESSVVASSDNSVKLQASSLAAIVSRIGEELNYDYSVEKVLPFRFSDCSGEVIVKYIHKPGHSLADMTVKVNTGRALLVYQDFGIDGTLNSGFVFSGGKLKSFDVSAFSSNYSSLLGALEHELGVKSLEKLVALVNSKGLTVNNFKNFVTDYALQLPDCNAFFEVFGSARDSVTGFDSMKVKVAVNSDTLLFVDRGADGSLDDGYASVNGGRRISASKSGLSKSYARMIPLLLDELRKR